MGSGLFHVSEWLGIVKLRCLEQAKSLTTSSTEEHVFSPLMWRRFSASRRQSDPDPDDPRSVLRSVFRQKKKLYPESDSTSLSSSSLVFKYSSPSRCSRTRSYAASYANHRHGRCHLPEVRTHDMQQSMMTGAPPAQAPAAPPPPGALPQPLLRYRGVQRSPCGRWMALVLDPDKRPVRVIGAFPNEHAAALAHDRVAIAIYGAGASLNFKPAFHPIEHEFLMRCRNMGKNGVIDVCNFVADGSYEDRYAAFLRAVLAREQYGEFLEIVLQFYIDRAAEIGEEALLAGGDKLVDRFVAMHRNRAVDPRWRSWYHRMVAQVIAKKQRPQNNSSSSTVPARPSA